MNDRGPQNSTTILVARTTFDPLSSPYRSPLLLSYLIPPLSLLEFEITIHLDIYRRRMALELGDNTHVKEVVDDLNIETVHLEDVDVMPTNYFHHDSNDDLEASSMFLNGEKDRSDISTFSRKSNLRCRYCVEQLQGIELPKWCCSSTDGSRIHLIQGVDRVVFGTKAASECVVICGIKPVRYLWYMLSGSVCDALQLLIDLFLHRVVSISDPSKCWILGFAISIVARHSSHRYLVFGDYVGGYWRSLLRMYAGYSIIIVISTIFNVIMTRDLHFSHYVAWFITLLWTGIVNYFILKYLWTFGGSTNGGTSDVSKSQKPSINSKSPRRD